MSVCFKAPLRFYELRKGAAGVAEEVTSVGRAAPDSGFWILESGVWGLESDRIFVTYGGKAGMWLSSAGTVIKCRLPRSLRTGTGRPWEQEGRAGRGESILNDPWVM